LSSIHARSDLRNADARGAFLVQAKLARVDLRDATLWDADLRDADLSMANLSGALLRDADLSGASLVGAELMRADLRGADLSGANLRSLVNVTQAQLDDACGNAKPQLSPALTIRTCSVTAPPASPSPPTGSSPGP
jgi:uncharacterized protein YjbI with pentapeptide repeats